MAEVKLTKNELRIQQVHLSQLEKYLPTLQLKKAMLQTEVQEARLKIEALEKIRREKYQKVEAFSALLVKETSFNPLDAVKIKQVKRRFENIAGVEVPYFEGMDFEEFKYSLFETAPWIDTAIDYLKALVEAKIKVEILYEQKAALEKELREVSIRVNLFEKILIPRAKKNIRTIKVFLGDQELAAVARAKVAKAKIEKNKQISLAAT